MLFSVPLWVFIFENPARKEKGAGEGEGGNVNVNERVYAWTEAMYVSIYACMFLSLWLVGWLGFLGFCCIS